MAVASSGWIHHDARLHNGAALHLSCKYWTCTTRYPSPQIKKKDLHTLHMVSQKDKRKRREEAQRTAALKEAEIIRAQKLLVVQLNELQGGRDGYKHVPQRQVKKLLKNAAHDGLEDIGPEARRFAIQTFHAANRPADVKPLLLSIHSTTGNDVEHRKEVDQFGLWAFSALGEWETAAQYANHLYNNTSNHEGDDEGGNVFATVEARDQLRRAAIEAFANTGSQNTALELLQPDRDGTSVVNTILHGCLRTGTLEDVRRLLETLDDHQSATISAFDKESFRLLLKCAAQFGDIPLFEHALSNLSAEDTGASELAMFLEKVIAGADETKPLLLSNQSIAADIFEALLEKRNGKKFVKPGLLSRLFFALDHEDYLDRVFQCCKRIFADDTSHSWISDLYPAAKARILPRIMVNYSDDLHWKVLTSLAKTDNPQKSGAFLRNQPLPFFDAALAICEKRWISDNEALELAMMIVQEYPDALLTNPVERADYLYHLSVSFRLFIVLPTLTKTDEEKSIELLEKVANMIVNNIHKAVQEEEIVSGTTQVSSNKASFSNAKLDAIVNTTVRLLHAVKAVTAAPLISSEGDDLASTWYKPIAIQASMAAMRMVAELPEFSVQALWKNGKALDNKAREAVQTIMKELIQTNLLSDDQLVEPAMSYYFALAQLSTSCSTIDYKSLLFPVSYRALLPQADPFKTFQKCVLEGKRDLGFMQSALVPLIGDIGDYDDELTMLLPSIIEMTRQIDQRNGGTYYTAFLDKYQKFFISGSSGKPDLFLDPQFMDHLCDVLMVHKDLPLDELEAWVWFRDLWDIKLSNALIQRLASCQDLYSLFYREDDITYDSILSGSAMALINMYRSVDSFSRMSDEAGNSLGEAYLEACRANVRRFISYWQPSNREFRSERELLRFIISYWQPSNEEQGMAGSRRKRESRSEREMLRFTLTKDTLGAISSIVEDCGWSPPISLLVADFLSAAFFQQSKDLPYEGLDKLLGKLLVDSDSLCPEIEAMVKAIIDKEE